MRYFSNNKGSVLVIAALFVFILTLSFIELGHIYNETTNIIEEQNKKDAHMLSVISLYVETLDKVSWVNKQLKRIALLCAAAILIPELAPMVQVAQKISMGLQKYQDVLLLRLKIYAPILDVDLRRQNHLNILPNIHYVEYRRQTSINLGFFQMPGLIEFKSDIFRTACIQHKGIITNSGVCVDSQEYGDTKDGWFAPTEDTWGIKLKNA